VTQTSEAAMKEIKAIVRRDRVQAVIEGLEAVGAARMIICHVHALGAGVDPTDFRVSFEEGASYTQKSKVEVVCEDGEADAILTAISTAGRTGRPGDGIILVSDVERVVSVRNAEEGPLALL
jgi:nitrogen regulatory protein P-II 1